MSSPLALITAIAATFAYGISDYAGGRASTGEDARHVVISAQARSLVPVTIWLIVVESVPTWTGVLSGVGVGLASCLSVTLLFRSLSRAPSALVAPLCAVLGGVVSAGVGVVGGNRLPLLSIIGGIAALVGVIVPALSVRSWFSEAKVGPIVDAGIAGIASGFAIALIALVRPSQLPWLLFFERITTITVLRLISRNSVKAEQPSHNSLEKWIVGVGYVFASWALHSSTAQSSLAVTAIIVSCYPLITICLSVLIDHERIGFWRAAGLGVAVSGLALLSAR